MNKLITILLFAILLMVSATGCKKYLEVQPRGEDVPTTIDEYNGLFNNTLLADFSTYQISTGSFSPGEMVSLAIFMSDEAYTLSPYNAGVEASNVNGYRWDADIYLPMQDAGEWATFYEQLYTYNVIAAGVMNATDGTDSAKAALLAEARANRALMYLMLVNYFGKPYNATSASTDPGVPLITAPAANQSAGPRSSVQAVYDFITGELTAAIPALPAGTINRLRLDQPAALCILGKAYFLMGKYDSALMELEAAQQLLPGSTATMALYDYNVVLPQWASPIPNFPPSTPFGPNNTETICGRGVYVSMFRGNVFLDSNYQLYDSTDLRLAFFSKTDYSGTAIYPGWTRTGPISVNYGPSMPDLYLMLAECKARGGDIPGATADLDTLRTHRMPASVALVNISSQDSLIRYIVQERYREFALTGINWFDVRRLWNDPLFNGKTYTHMDDQGTYTLSADRLTLKIPPLIVGYNPSMVNNP